MNKDLSRFISRLRKSKQKEIAATSFGFSALNAMLPTPPEPIIQQATSGLLVAYGVYFSLDAIARIKAPKLAPSRDPRP